MAVDDDNVSQEDLDVAKAIGDKHRITTSELYQSQVLQLALMSLGFGRNEKTARILRFIADIIECPILSYEDEARMGKPRKV